jgi:hypothetical protein
VESFDQFKADLVVERNATARTRIDDLVPAVASRIAIMAVPNASGVRRAQGRRHDAAGQGQLHLQPGALKREAVIGADAVHGFKEMPQASFIEGEIADSADLRPDALARMNLATATCGWPAADDRIARGVVCRRGRGQHRGRQRCVPPGRRLRPLRCPVELARDIVTELVIGRVKGKHLHILPEANKLSSTTPAPAPAGLMHRAGRSHTAWHSEAPLHRRELMSPSR